MGARRDVEHFTDLNALYSSRTIIWREVLAGNDVAHFPSTSASYYPAGGASIVLKFYDICYYFQIILVYSPSFLRL